MLVTDLKVAQKLIYLADSAKSRNLEFNITFRKLRQILSNSRCYYTGILFEPEGSNKLTIDRVDSTIGYIDSNIVACASRINAAKSNLSIKEFEGVCRGMKKHKNK